MELPPQTRANMEGPDKYDLHRFVVVKDHRGDDSASDRNFLAVMTPPSLPGLPLETTLSQSFQNHPAQRQVCGEPTPPPEPAKVAQQIPSLGSEARSHSSCTFHGPLVSSSAHPTSPAAPMASQMASQLMPPPPRPCFKAPKRPAPQSSVKRAASTNFHCGENNDPSLRTQTKLPLWPRTCCIAPMECRLDFGNVASPTYMLLLPFGGTIEMAAYYPKDTQRENR